MKRFLICYLFTITTFLYAQQTIGKNEVLFIKGSISDKIAAVKNASEKEVSVLSISAVDFALNNFEKLGNDRELSALAFAGVLAFPAQISDTSVVKKLTSLFSLFSDVNTRVAVVNKLVQLYEVNSDTTIISFLSEYLSQSMMAKEPVSDIHKAVVVGLGSIGNGSAMKTLYEAYVGQYWPTLNDDIGQAIENLADKSIPEIIDIISQSNTDNLQALFSIIVNSSSIGDSLKSEIAENILSELLYLVGKENKITDKILNLEFDCVSVISAHKWTRAASFVISFFAQVKELYTANQIDESKMITAIQSLSTLSSTEAAKALTAYLNQLNETCEKGTVPSTAVVEAVIQALGALGNKVAFDDLLYVTYLPYPEHIIVAARNALTILKW
ncbi:MAG: hypothetical protein K6E51_07805 [Treponema sp.]|nr:hypothetical protein [Treponema sp.]